MGFPQLILVVKNLSANERDIKRQLIQSLDWEDPLEEGMATHSSILAWRNPLDREAWWATVQSIAKIWTGLKQLGKQAHICIYTIPTHAPYIHIHISW